VRRWWLLIPLFTVGLGTFILVGVAGIKLRSRATILAAAAYLVLTALYLSATPGLSESSVAYNVILFVYVFGAWIGGTVHAALLQPKWIAARTVIDDPAVAAVKWRAQRRQEARQLLAKDPAMAAELAIGRPDRANRRYADGGLIDLNHVPADWLIQELEMTPAQASEIVRVRELKGGFASADELVVYCAGFTVERIAVIRDRLVFIPL
jgi:hypothetical protein